jgi:hypothetical protein
MDYQSRQRRYEYSRKFSWAATARATIEAFADCISNAQRKTVAITSVGDHE